MQCLQFVTAPSVTPGNTAGTELGDVNWIAKGAECQRAAWECLGFSSLPQLLLPGCAQQGDIVLGTAVMCTARLFLKEIPQLFCPESPKQCWCGSIFHMGTLSSVFQLCWFGNLSHLGIRTREIRLALKGPFLLLLGMLTAERTLLSTCSSC